METARLVIAVDSSGAKRATDSLDKLDRAAGSSERAAHKLGRAWGTAIGLISSAAIIGATRAYLRQADAMANLNARLRLVTDSAHGFARAQQDVFDIAQRTATDLEATAELYFKLAQSSDDLRRNQERLAGIVETVSQSLVVSGADAASTTAVIRQFSQALASGALRGDEFISVMEGAPRLAKAIADGLGVPIGQLRALAAQGDLTAAKIIRALEDQGAAVDREYGKMPLTVARSVEKVENSLQRLIGKTDETAGASQGLAVKIDELATLLQSQGVQDGFNAIVGGLTDVVRLGAKATTTMANFAHWVGEAAARSQGFVAADDTLGTRERLADLRREQQRRRSAPEGTGVLAAMFGTSWSALGIGDKTDAEISAEIARLEQYIRMQEEAAATAAKAARAAAKAADDAMWASATVVTANPSLWGANTATGGVQQRIQAQRDLNTEVEKALTLEQEWAILEAEVYGPAAIEAHNKRVTKWAEEGQAIEQATDKMSLYADQAARNMQDAFAQFLFDPFENGVKGMVESFANAIREMLAQAAAAKIFDMLGQWATGYSGTGASFINGIGQAISGGRAGGGPVMAGHSYWVGESGKAELFTPSTNGTISQGGGQVTVKQGDVYLEVVNNGEPAHASMSREKQPDGSQLIRLVLNAVGESFSTGSGAPYMGAKQRFNLRDAV